MSVVYTPASYAPDDLRGPLELGDAAALATLRPCRFCGSATDLRFMTAYDLARVR